VKYKNHKVVLDFYRKTSTNKEKKVIQFFFSASALSRDRGMVAVDGAQTTINYTICICCSSQITSRVLFFSFG
jgi:hypothetical protein